MERERTARRPRVVIVGGGFGGLSAAKALRGADVDVTLVDRTNHYLFQPLLYQVATGVLSPADVAVPIRFLLRRQRNTTVLLADVDSIDLAGRTVQAGDTIVEFDFLIVATGSRHSYFGHPEWEPIAPGLKTLEDARHIRHRFLRAFELAEKSTNPAEQQALLTFVIVGGGPTGVELAGILPTIAAKGLRPDFRRVDPASIRVLLLEGGPRLLPTFPEALSARARSDLEQLGVECRTNALVTRITSDCVYIGDERIPTRTVYWAAGNIASPLVRTLNVPVDRAGRVFVEPDLSIPGVPNVFVVGDAAAVVDIRSNGMAPTPVISNGATLPGPPGEPDKARPTTDGTVTSDAVARTLSGLRQGSGPARRSEAEAAGPRSEGDKPRPTGAVSYVPGVAPAANQMGTHAARTILATLAGRPREPFRYWNKGALAVIGRNRAVADFGRFSLSGLIGWWFWVLVHIAYLAGFRNRLSVMLEWAYAYFTFRPGARLITEEEHSLSGREG
jgi:NADH dehydrogenase